VTSSSGLRPTPRASLNTSKQPTRMSQGHGCDANSTEIIRRESIRASHPPQTLETKSASLLKAGLTDATPTPTLNLSGPSRPY
jgi:hypothetical protein